jgi:hypothetical protein
MCGARVHLARYKHDGQKWLGPAWLRIIRRCKPAPNGILMNKMLHIITRVSHLPVQTPKNATTEMKHNAKLQPRCWQHSGQPRMPRHKLNSGRAAGLQATRICITRPQALKSGPKTFRCSLSLELNKNTRRTERNREPNASAARCLLLLGNGQGPHCTRTDGVSRHEKPAKSGGLCPPTIFEAKGHDL